MAWVVVVDDQQLNLKMVRMTLESEGYDVIPLQDPMALENLIAKTRIDAVILDLVMPGLSGFDLIEILRENPQTRDTPIIVLTSKTEAPDRVRGLRAGADDYMCKPFDPAELIARLEGLLERKVRDEMSLQGSLLATPVSELFQFIAQNSKIGTIQINNKDQAGFLQIYAGLILNARFGQFQGANAAEAMLEFETGDFRFNAEELPAPNPEAQYVQLQELLMTFAWITDELTSRRQFLPGDTVGLRIGKSLGAIPLAMGRVPIGEVAKQIESLPGVSLEGLLSRWIAPPNRLRLALAWLVERNIVLMKTSGSQSIVS